MALDGDPLRGFCALPRVLFVMKGGERSSVPTSKGATMNTMTLGTVSVASSEAAIGGLPVATGMDAREVAIPLAVVHERRPGPTLLVEGGLHGIEIATIDICRRLLRKQLDPRACYSLFGRQILNHTDASQELAHARR